MPGRSEAAETDDIEYARDRVEFVSFPDSIRFNLYNLLEDDFNRRAPENRHASANTKPEQASALVRCVWVEKQNNALSLPSSSKILIALGRALSIDQQAELISGGVNAVIDLQATTIGTAATLINAYADQAETINSKEHSSQPVETETRASDSPYGWDLKFLSSAVESLEIGVFAVDETRNGTITIWNKQMENLFGKPRSEIEGTEISAVFADQNIANLFRQQEVPFVRTRAIIPSQNSTNKNFLADVSKTLILDENGTPRFTVGFVQDYTQRIYSENRLIAAFNELESSKERLEHSNIEIRKGIEKAKKLAVVAQSSNKAKSYFLSNISHELRTPLNSILSLTHALLDGAFGDLNRRQSENLKIVSDSSQHLHALINDILDLSKIELGKMNLKIATTSIEEIAISTVRMVEQEAANKKVSCHLELNTNLTEIEVDAKRLRQILLNLLVNAIKFTDSGKEVKLKIEDDADTQAVVFHVIDQGIGIEESNFDKIFSPFTQLDESLSRQFEGTGLGLAIASKLIELHGGGLRLQSAKKQGSTFSVLLPYSQVPPLRSDETKLNLPDLASESHFPYDLCLVVDENEMSAHRICHQIKEISSIKAVHALPNVISAYHDKIAPLAVIADLAILQSHGSEWISAAKKLYAWRHTKWIAIGSIDLPECHKLARKYGFDACSCKPIPLSLLKNLIGK